MLNCIAAIHSRDFEGCLNAMDDGVKYYGSMDLPNYFKMIPVFLGQMCDVRRNDKATWDRLKTDFVVTKSTEAFVNLLVDQGLEQEIKDMKRYGALPGLTQEDDALDRFIITLPRLRGMVEKFLTAFPRAKKSESNATYHQLQGNIGLR